MAANLQTNTSLRIVGGQNVLFHQGEQSILHLNETAAFIWRSLEQGIAPENISAEIMRLGVAPQQAESYVSTAISEWEGLGVLRPTCPLSPSIEGQPAPTTQDIAVAGVRIKLVYSARATAAAQIFKHLEQKAREVDVYLKVVDRGNRLHVFRDDEWLFSCLIEEFATSVKAQLLDYVLELSNYVLALHAATLVRNDCMLLLTGRPGAGKTTLTLALVHAGFGFAGDDVSLINENAGAAGIPFAPAVKVGAWPLVARYWPAIYDAPVFRRPDRKRVRYLLPDRLEVFADAGSVGWVVLLRRERGARALLRSVEPIRALRVLLDGAFAPGGQLTAVGFQALTRIVVDAACYELTYSRLEDAVECLRESCQ